MSADPDAGPGSRDASGEHGSGNDFGWVAGLQVGSGNIQVNYLPCPAVAGSAAMPSTEVPAVPRAVHGRDDIVDRLVELSQARHRCPPQVLTGAGGMGKSTIARLVAARVRDGDPNRRVWWVSAANEERLSGGLIRVAQELGASTADQDALRSHAAASLGSVADRVWRLLDCCPSRWLLVIDNADDPSLLGPSDGTGWVRSSRSGLLLVTTRHADEECWPEAELTPVRLLSPAAAADVLIELAPRAGDREAAAALAVRLGFLPIALHLAGTYLRQDFVSWHTFDEYRGAFDALGAASIIGTSELADPGVTQTWELSLDALERSGRAQSRLLMWLLSCFAPGARIPEELVTVTGPDTPLAALLVGAGQVPQRQLAAFCMAGLQGLATVGLIQRVHSPDGSWAIELHPLISEVTRSFLEANESARTGIDTRVVRECAAIAVRKSLSRLDPGSADDWPGFRVLTSHLIDLLTNAAPHLSKRHQRALLNSMVWCISSYIWSRAESWAEHLARDALSLASRLGARQEPVYQRLRHTYAWSLREQGRFQEAELVFGDVLAELKRMPGGPADDYILHARHDLAWTIGRQGNWSAAEREFREVLRLRREQRQRMGLPGDDPDILHTRCMLSWSIGKQGRWDVAERDYQRLAEDRADILGRYHADTLDTRENIGKCLAWQREWAQARHEWAKLADQRAETLGERNPDTLRTRQLAAYAGGLLARESGSHADCQKAAAELNEILYIQADVRGEDHQETQETRALLTDLDGLPRPVSLWPEDLPRPVRPSHAED